MAATVLEFRVQPYRGGTAYADGSVSPVAVVPTLVKLATTAAGQVSPAASYALSEVSGWLYSATVAEALVGIYYWYVEDAGTNVIADGYVYIPADDTGTYRSGKSYAEVATQQSLADGGRTDLILDAILAKTNLINSGTANATNSDQTLIRITRNDSYDGTANAALSWTVGKDYTSGWTGTFTIRHRTTGDSLLSKSVTVTDATTLTVSLDSTDTAFTALTTNSDFGAHPYDIQMLNGTSRQTAVQGPCKISKDETLT